MIIFISTAANGYVTFLMRTCNLSLLFQKRLITELQGIACFYAVFLHHEKHIKHDVAKMGAYSILIMIIKLQYSTNKQVKLSNEFLMKVSYNICHS